MIWTENDNKAGLKKLMPAVEAAAAGGDGGGGGGGAPLPEGEAPFANCAERDRKRNNVFN